MIKVTTKTNEIFYFNHVIYPIASDDYIFTIACFNYVNKHNIRFLLEDIISIEKQISDLNMSEMRMLDINLININDNIIQFNTTKNVTTELKTTDFIDITQSVKDCSNRAAMVLTQTLYNYYND